MISYLVGCLFDSVVLNAIVVLTIVYFLFTSHNEWRKLNVVGPSPVLLFGNTFKMTFFLENESETLDRIYRQFPDEKICGYYRINTPILMIRDPELIQTVMIKDFAYFTDHGLEMDPTTNLMARSLFFANGQRWKTMRQKLSPGFSSGKLKDTYNQIKKCSDQLVSTIIKKSKKTDQQFEVKSIIGNFSTDVIGTCAFGLTLDTIVNEDSEFRTHIKKLFGSGNFLQLLKTVMWLFVPKITKFLKIQIFSQDSMKFFHSVFSDVIDYRAKNNMVRNDLAQTLIRAREELVLNNDLTGIDKYSDLDIISNAIMMFFAGSEPVSITLSICLYELALNKDIQDKLRSEIHIAKQNHNGKLNSDFLAELHYAEMVVNETLRKYSNSANIIRIATDDYNVPGESLFIKKGQKIVLPLYSVHRDPKYYPNPNTFDPERFNAEEKSKRPKGTFFPFGDGPRQCIAKRFAEMEMKLALAEILLKFEILPCEQTKIPLKMKMLPGFITPKDEIWLRFKQILN